MIRVKNKSESLPDVVRARCSQQIPSACQPRIQLALVCILQNQFYRLMFWNSAKFQRIKKCQTIIEDISKLK